MNMATATKTKSVQVVGPPIPRMWEPGEILAGKLDESAAVVASVDRLVETIARRPHDSITPVERICLKAGITFDNDFELFRMHVNPMRARIAIMQEFSFEGLEAAKVELEQVQEKLDTTQASLVDLERIAGDEPAGPILLRQEAAIRKQYTELVVAVATAAAKVERLQGLQKILEDRAPQSLKDLFELRREELRQTGEYKAFVAVESEVRSLECTIKAAEPGGVLDCRNTNTISVVANYCAINCPLAVTTEVKGRVRSTKINQPAFQQHIDEVRVQLEGAKLRMATAEVALAEREKEIDPMGPIHAWIDAKGLCMDMLK
jgi:hypothetical protein